MERGAQQVSTTGERLALRPEALDERGPIGSTQTAPIHAAAPEFTDQSTEAAILVTGVEDPDTRAHGANEGLHLAEFEKVVLAEAFLLRNLGAL